jgi:SWI/SNF-related matrix-associated actin-dependent regulator of chromatin subfamily A3
MKVGKCKFPRGGTSLTDQFPAHVIRNQSTKAFGAVASLTGHIRWCLTGTPIQNRLEDLGALVQFLQVPGLAKAYDFKKHCINPAVKMRNRGSDNLRALLQCICIRRTKELIRLPEFQTVERCLVLSQNEKSAYEMIVKRYKASIDDAISGRKPADAYRYIFQALLKLRQVCNHGRIMESSPKQGKEQEDKLLARLQEGTVFCAYCSVQVGFDGPSDETPVAELVGCGHIVCRGCLELYHEDLQRIKEGFEIACRTCSVPLAEENSNIDSPQGAEVVNAPGSPGAQSASTKFASVLEDIKCSIPLNKWYVPVMILRSLSQNNDIYSIVFSSWRKSLDEFAAILSIKNMRFVQLDGTLNLPARQQILDTFRSDEATSILLMTLATGSVG